MDFGNAASFTVQMEGPFGNFGITAKTGSVTLKADAWKGAESPYSQSVQPDIISANSIIDFQPDCKQLEYLCSAHIALLAENDAGAVTVYALGGKPAEDMTMQITATEVVAI